MHPGVTSGIHLKSGQVLTVAWMVDDLYFSLRYTMKSDNGFRYSAFFNYMKVSFLSICPVTCFQLHNIHVYYYIRYQVNRRFYWRFLKIETLIPSLRG